ncbi:ABC transporter permease [Catenisphaera adipataccumulans]|uniref:Transport permease protein n=1 Tax=Catenisphaera adipataccumulans TaxID=700500 RepID=A0A7W8CYF3_9FIRM|nr:ABC transporter permease [Catenisphaera adipataccumulans]MBB5183861.1 teichoic acid transport system permease protein [Catenisphaera adipataccumulans]
MLKSVTYVLKENLSNLYRIYSISKYELLGDMRDSKFGIFWNFASPAIQVFTYWLVFGIAWGRNAVTYRGITVSYLPWLVVGFACWWYIRPCITEGCSAVFSKTNVITKMKFPVSVLPATVCLKELFNHWIMMIITIVTLMLCGYYPNWNWLWILYYMFCAFMLAEAIGLVLSVLTMLWRDVKKFITSIMRMLMYFSPILWTCEFKSHVPFHSLLNKLVKANPVYYIIQGYRDAVFYGRSVLNHPVITLYFWCLVLVIFIIGCALMYKFKKKFIDMI